MGEEIIVRGARVHNLKNISCTIPHNKITVVTGLSGSGKSSLAFDTLVCGGANGATWNLSPLMRAQFLERMEKPETSTRFPEGIQRRRWPHPPEEHHAESALDGGDGY